MISGFGVEHVAKLHDSNRAKAEYAGGATALVAAANQRRIGEAAGRGYQRFQTGRVRSAQNRVSELRTGPKPVPGSGRTWAQAAQSTPKTDRYGAKLNGPAYKRQVRLEHSNKIRQAQGVADKAQGRLSRAPKMVEHAGKATMFGGAVAGGLLLAAGAHENAEPSPPLVKLKKYTDREVEGGAVGAAAGLVAYQEPSYRAKTWEKRKFNDVIAKDPAMKARYEAHKAKYGIGRGHPAGGQEWVRMFRNYPKDLPGAGFKRTLAYTHGGKSGAVLQTAAAATGAVVGSKLAGKAERHRLARQGATNRGRP